MPPIRPPFEPLLPLNSPLMPIGVRQDLNPPRKALVVTLRVVEPALLVPGAVVLDADIARQAISSSHSAGSPVSWEPLLSPANRGSENHTLRHDSSGEGSKYGGEVSMAMRPARSNDIPRFLVPGWVVLPERFPPRGFPPP